MKNESIGAIWKKQGQYGEYMSGNIIIEGKEYKINIYTNGHKKEDKHPDYRIFVKKDKEEIQNEQNYNNDNFDLPF